MAGRFLDKVAQLAQLDKLEELAKKGCLRSQKSATLQKRLRSQNSQI